LNFGLQLITKPHGFNGVENFSGSPGNFLAVSEITWKFSCQLFFSTLAPKIRMTLFALLLSSLILMVASHAAPSGVCNPTPRILASPNRVDGDLFGASVAVDNDTLVVGIPGINTQSALRLEVYKYNAGADDWVFDQPLGNLCAVENRRYSVAWLRLCGNNIFVLGGYISDKCNATLTWFRRRSSTDDFVFMSSNAFGGEIGSMISCQVTPLGVTRIAIGMIGGYVTDDPILWPGRVTLWEENGGTITRVANISGTSIGVDPSTNFGHPALVQGDFVFVGARYTNVNGNMQAGTVHQFSWAAQPTHKALVPTSPPFELGAKGSQYGVALAFGGNSTLFVVGNTVFSVARHSESKRGARPVGDVCEWLRRWRVCTVAGFDARGRPRACDGRGTWLARAGLRFRISY
jgi:hypothetical protein